MRGKVDLTDVSYGALRIRDQAVTAKGFALSAEVFPFASSSHTSGRRQAQGDEVAPGDG